MTAETSSLHPEIIFTDLDVISYDTAWDYQEKIFNESIEKKISGVVHSDTLLFCEHPHVYTLGKSGNMNNLLVNPDFLKSINATYYRSNRGGDITYHGPGQIVGYPIFDLDHFDIGVKKYVAMLEEAIIRALSEFGIAGQRLDDATGVWVKQQDSDSFRKICAIGIRASRNITMHGFALNVNTDLAYFDHINPCGFVDRGVTSMERELHEKIELKKVKSVLLNNIFNIFAY